MSRNNAARPDIATRSIFDALSQEDEQDTYESEEEDAAIPEPTATPGSSKRAKARKRAAERKRLAANPSSAEPTEALPAVPTIPAKFVEKGKSNGKVANGTPATRVEELVGSVAAPIVDATESVAEGIVDSSVGEAILASGLPVTNVAESVASSDAESVARAYPSDDDDDDDVDAEPSPSPTPKLTQDALPSAPAPIPAKLLSTKTSATSLAGTTTTPSTAQEPQIVYTGADHDPGKKLTAIITRTIYGILMAAGLISIVCLGQIYVIVLVFCSQAVVFSELSGLFDAGYSSAPVEGEVSIATKRELLREERRRGRKAERDRWGRRMSWYFFAATNYFLYGESLIYYFKHILTLQASFLPTTFSFAQHHRLISFGLYVIGFVSFVANLQRTQLRRQFGLFGWIHMSLLLVVVSSHFIVNNILEGLIWFWVPASLVITNDIAAYVCGMLFGRHQLIKLSPKKTVEGFVGAFFVTIVFAYFWSTLFMRSNYMICPVQDLASNVFSHVSCTPNPVFVWREFPLPIWASQSLHTLTRQSVSSIPWAPFQLHSIVLAVFASLVAPFGGFFASGFKRAFNIKDFGASIPGHGGLTDRMDCQFLMGLFTYVWYASLVRQTHVTVGSVLATIVTAFSTEEQMELLADLTKVLAQKGLKAATPWSR